MNIENHPICLYPQWFAKAEKSKFQKIKVTENMIYFLGNYLNDIASLGYQLQNLNVGMVSSFFGSFIATVIDHEEIPDKGFNDFDSAIHLYNFFPESNCINENLVIVIHQFVLQILQPKKYLFDPQLPFANYHLPLSSYYVKDYPDQQTYIDLTVYFRPTANSEIDCTGSGDGFKLIPFWMEENQLGFKLTQSSCVDKYSPLKKSLSLLKKGKYKVSIEHAKKIRNGLWAYIRHKLNGKTYISVEDQLNDYSKLLEACCPPFFERYQVVEKLDKKMKKYVDSHFKKKKQLISPFFQEVAAAVKDFACSHGLEEQSQAIKLLERIENCFRRCLNVYRSFNKEDLEIIRKHISLLENIIAKQKPHLKLISEEALSIASDLNNESSSPVQGDNFNEQVSSPPSPLSVSSTEILSEAPPSFFPGDGGENPLELPINIKVEEVLENIDNNLSLSCPISLPSYGNDYKNTLLNEIEAKFQESDKLLTGKHWFESLKLIQEIEKLLELPEATEMPKRNKIIRKKEEKIFRLTQEFGIHICFASNGTALNSPNFELFEKYFASNGYDLSSQVYQIFLQAYFTQGQFPTSFLLHLKLIALLLNSNCKKNKIQLEIKSRISQLIKLENKIQNSQLIPQIIKQEILLITNDLSLKGAMHSIFSKKKEYDFEKKCKDLYQIIVSHPFSALPACASSSSSSEKFSQTESSTIPVSNKLNQNQNQNNQTNSSSDSQGENNLIKIDKLSEMDLIIQEMRGLDNHNVLDIWFREIDYLNTMKVSENPETYSKMCELLETPMKEAFLNGGEENAQYYTYAVYRYFLLLLALNCIHHLKPNKTKPYDHLHLKKRLIVAYKESNYYFNASPKLKQEANILKNSIAHSDQLNTIMMQWHRNHQKEISQKQKTFSKNVIVLSCKNCMQDIKNTTQKNVWKIALTVWLFSILIISVGAFADSRAQRRGL